MHAETAGATGCASRKSDTRYIYRPAGYGPKRSSADVVEMRRKKEKKIKERKKKKRDSLFALSSAEHKIEAARRNGP